MRGKELLIGLAALVGLLGSSCKHFIRHEPTVVMETKPTTVIDLDIDRDKEDVSLKCKRVDKVTTKGFSFYACHEDIDFELVDRLEYVAAVKKFGRERLGFKNTKNYREYKNNVTEKPKTYYRLYVVPKFEIPEKWRGHYHDVEVDSQLWIKIRKPTIFRSSVDNLIDEKKRYIARVYDTYWRSYTNFSGGCNLVPKFFEDTPEEQADTILHEDLHENTEKESGIEESIATLIGRAGAVEFTGEYFGKDSEEHKRAKEKLKSWHDNSLFVMKYYNKLETLYAQEMPLEEKMRKKREIQKQAEEERRRLNNADIWDDIPYTKNFPLVYKVYEKYPDTGELVKILLKAPEKEEEAIEYLKKFLEEE